MQLAWQFLDPAEATHRAALASLYPRDSQGAASQNSLNHLLASPGICGLLGWESLGWESLRTSRGRALCSFAWPASPGRSVIL